MTASARSLAYSHSAAQERTSMAFGKRKGGGGDFLPLLKYDARNGSLYLEARVQTSRGWEKEQTNVGSAFKGVFDLANAEVGWIHFPRGAAPETALVPAGHDMGTAPSEDHKQGFRVLVLVDRRVHEFMSTSGAAWNGLSALHDEYLAELGKHPGELPNVALTKVTEHRYGAGGAFEPEFKIIGWTKRPEEFGPERDPNARPAPTPNKKLASEMDDAIPF
jgi:hypothetical protein